MEQVIVFGNDSYNTAGSIRCLGEIGLQPIAIVMSNRHRIAVKKSKYLSECYVVKSLDEGYEIILKYKNLNHKIYIFATSDKMAAYLDLRYDELKDYFIFPNCGGQGLLTKWMDKSLMCSVAAECGIRIPWTVSFHKGDVLPDDITYPCLVKPQKSVEGTKQEIRHFNSEKELTDFLKSDTITRNFVIQQYIKKEYEILLIGCRTTDGKVFVPAYLKNFAWVNEGDVDAYGPICRGCCNLVNFESVEKFLNRINYVGPFSIECGIENNIAYFFEINLRNDGTINYFTKVGVNIPEMFLKDKLIVDKSKSSSAIYADEFGYILNVIRGEISFKEWYENIRKATVFKYYDKYDKGPFFVFMPKMLRVVMATLYRKITGRL